MPWAFLENGLSRRTFRKLFAGWGAAAGACRGCPSGEGRSCVRPGCGSAILAGLVPGPGQLLVQAGRRLFIDPAQDVSGPGA